jgi:scyllo-inositol 2-dehydrogenase (NADP+)
MTRDTFNVALIGYGLAGSAFHAPLISHASGLSLTAIVTSNPDRRKTAAQAHPGATLYESADELLSHSREFDVVVVATPNSTHVPLTLSALDAGLVVVVDKPLAATAAQARRLVSHAASSSGRLTVFQNRRWDGDFMTVRQLISEGALGDVWRCESRFERWVPTPKPGWREDPDPNEGGGVLLDLGAHLVDQALRLFGPATTVYSELDIRRSGALVVDDAFIAVTHRNGVHSHLWMSATAAARGPRFRVLGDKAGYATFGMDVQEAALRSGSGPGLAGYGEAPPEAWGTLDDGVDQRRVPTLPGDYPAFYTELAKALASEGPMPVDPQDAIATLDVIEAAQKSSLTHRVIALPTS